MPRSSPAPVGDHGSPPTDDAFRRHADAHEQVSDCPLLPGNAVHLFESGADTMAGLFEAIAAARDHVHMEYYIFQDVHHAGQSLIDLLVRKCAEGVLVAIIYDGIGSVRTPDAAFERLEAAGAKTLEFRSLNPLKRHFSLRANDRDHRKLLVVDGRIGFLGGVNMAEIYENPRSAGVARDPDHSFWYDAAARIEGPAVAEIQKLFFHSWRRYGGDPLPPRRDFPELSAVGTETIRTDGSAPEERRQLYYASLHAAVAVARSHIMLSTGYFIPTHQEWQMLAAAAERGVRVEILLASHSDNSGTLHAARALYGRLLRRGVEIREITDGLLHGKLATIDGVWSAIGSSNLDRRSYAYNNEIDAIVLGRATAARVEALLRDWSRAAEMITLAGWEHRSLREHAGELLARLWERYM